MATSQSSRNKVVLITGATGGIGRATAIAFAQAGGYDLALHYHAASQETRDAVRSAIEEVAKVKVGFFQADMSNYDSVRQLHREAVSFAGEIDILFANAGGDGGHTQVQNLASVPIEVFENTWRLNTGSPILLAQLCLPHMEQQSWGRVIFNSSVAAFTGGVVGPHYASSKSAQHGFVHWLANNMAKKGVTVNAVAPALIGSTNMLTQGVDEERQKRIAERVPVGRLGEPEEIAQTVLWMAKTGYLTNKVIGVDGGWYPY